MSASSATVFSDTVVLADTFAVATPEPRRGKAAAASGKELPPPAAADAGMTAAAMARALEVLRQSLNRELRFEVTPDGKGTVIYVLDRDTGELIRRIPSEELVRAVAPDGRFDLRLLDDRL